MIYVGFYTSQVVIARILPSTVWLDVDFEFQPFGQTIPCLFYNHVMGKVPNQQGELANLVAEVDETYPSAHPTFRSWSIQYTLQNPITVSKDDVSGWS